jgi:7,8-dihydro-6-hydroxymethylpterin-pyrophosphokinase
VRFIDVDLLMYQNCIVAEQHEQWLQVAFGEP